MENRNYFSLHCVQMETQLIHANMEALYYAFHRMVHEEAKAHAEVYAHFLSYFFLRVIQKTQFSLSLRLSLRSISVPITNAENIISPHNLTFWKLSLSQLPNLSKNVPGKCYHCRYLICRTFKESLIM